MMEVIKTFDNKKFRNAMIGKPPDHKTWQDHYEEGNYDKVYEMWKENAKESKGQKGNLWRCIMKIIENQRNKK